MIVDAVRLFMPDSIEGFIVVVGVVAAFLFCVWKATVGEKR